MMGDQIEDQSVVDKKRSKPGFNNFIILKELGNIVDLVKDEDLLEIVPKAKLRRVRWVPMFNYLKQTILDEMIQELSSMWESEDMNKKIETLQEQKEKFSKNNTEEVAWRPQLGDVKAQLKARDAIILQKQKASLEALANNYERDVKKLMMTITAKRGYVKALQLEIQKYQQKNEDLILKINERIENHKNIVKEISPMKLDIKNMNWKEGGIENS